VSSSGGVYSSGCCEDDVTVIFTARTWSAGASLLTLILGAILSAPLAFLAIFSNGDLDPLLSKPLAKRCGLDDSRELLGREDLKGLRKDVGQYREVLLSLESVGSVWLGNGILMGTDIDKAHLESDHGVSTEEWCACLAGNLPERALCTHR